MTISTTKMENAAMVSEKITKDARADVYSEGTLSVLRTGTTTKNRSARNELGALILTYDLEAVAGRYRARAVNRCVRTLFRNLARSETRQRENESDVVARPSEAVLSRPIAWLETSTENSKGEGLVSKYWIRDLFGRYRKLAAKWSKLKLYEPA